MCLNCYSVLLRIEAALRFRRCVMSGGTEPESPWVRLPHCSENGMTSREAGAGFA